jgi:putative holliday junction resolvase
MISSFLLGLDIGERYTGVAILDEQSGLALPREAWDVTDKKELVEKIKQVLLQDEISALVVGLPISMKGTDTPQTKRTQEIIQIISQNISIPVIVYDERLTSRLADTLMKGVKAGTKKHSIAAQKLLEDFYQNHRVQEKKKERLNQ